jgi:hypothetical protein
LTSTVQLQPRPDIGPRIDHVLATGEATWDEGLPLFLERSGFSEETYHTFSYAPLHVWRTAPEPPPRVPRSIGSDDEVFGVRALLDGAVTRISATAHGLVRTPRPASVTLRA